MNNLWDSIISAWLDYLGRKQIAEPYMFSDHEVISPGIEFRVSFFSPRIYLNLHPTLYALCISPDGEKQIIKGGLNPPFRTGRYVVHYVDKTDRQSELLKVTEITKDAARISLALKVIYRISRPLNVFDIQKPIETLYSQILADLKKYIQIHNYEDLIGGDNGEVIDSDLVAKYIKQQHGIRYPINQLFTIVDVIIQEKEGDPVFIEKRKNYTSQVVDGESKMKIQELNKRIASQEADMEQLRYQYKAVLDQQKASADVQQNAIRQQISIQELENQKLRDEWQQKQEAWRQKQEKWMRSMDAIDSAFKSQSPYLREEAEGLISAIVNELRVLAQPVDETRVAASQLDERDDSPKNVGDKLDTLTDRLFSLLDRRKRED